MRAIRSHPFALVLVVAALIALGGVSSAAQITQNPVDADNVVHGCYDPSNGKLDLDVHAGCQGAANPISWNARPVYLATTTSLQTDDQEIAVVNGIHITFSCFTRFDGGFIATVNAHAVKGERITAFGDTGETTVVYNNEVNLAQGALVEDRPFSNHVNTSNFVMETSSPVEQGVEAHIFLDASINDLGALHCTVTGTLTPIGGFRYVPVVVPH
jgi:hypothetical protein